MHFYQEVLFKTESLLQQESTVLQMQNVKDMLKTLP